MSVSQWWQQIDFSFILESLHYAQLEAYNAKYPTYDLCRQKLDAVDAIVAQVRALREGRLQLTENDIAFITVSLQNTRKVFENYDYPSSNVQRATEPC